MVLKTLEMPGTHVYYTCSLTLYCVPACRTQTIVMAYRQDRPFVADRPTKFTVWVGNLPNVQEKDLRQVFSRCGEVIGCSIPRRYGFVDFADEEGARRAIRELNGSEIRGKEITVRPSNRAQHRVGGGRERGSSRRDGEYRGESDWHPPAQASGYGRSTHDQCRFYLKGTCTYGEEVLM